MAVAAVIGGANANFLEMYKKVDILARNLTEASPRELNDPGSTLQISIDADPADNTPPQVFDMYFKAFYDKEGDPITYKMFYKDNNDLEREIIDTTNNTLINIPGGTSVVTIGGLQVTNGDFFKIDPRFGEMRFDLAANGEPVNKGDGTRVGLIKLDAVTGLDVALINDRIAQVNLAIEGLNKVLLAANKNLDTGINAIR